MQLLNLTIGNAKGVLMQTNPGKHRSLFDNSFAVTTLEPVFGPQQSGSNNCLPPQARGLAR